MKYLLLFIHLALLSGCVKHSEYYLIESKDIETEVFKGSKCSNAGSDLTVYKSALAQIILDGHLTSIDLVVKLYDGAKFKMRSGYAEVAYGDSSSSTKVKIDRFFNRYGRSSYPQFLDVTDTLQSSNDNYGWYSADIILSNLPNELNSFSLKFPDVYIEDSLIKLPIVFVSTKSATITTGLCLK